MKYMLLVYNDTQAMAALPPQDADAMMSECLASIDSLRQSGHLLDAMRLAPPQAAASLRMRNGRLSATDGPFAETKEQLGGFVLIEAKDLNEAIRLASAIPWTRMGCLEVRPLDTLGAPVHAV